MKVENCLKVLGILIAVGVLSTHISLTHGVWLIKQGQLMPVMLGMADILRWVLGLAAAWWLFHLKPISKWLLLLSFLFGLCASWVSYIPFGGYMMNYTDPTSWGQNLVAIQGPNLLLLVLVFYLLSGFEGSNNKLQASANTSTG